ncbi:MAG: TM0106 family RecB-like putative nuclease [Ilumatobacter sp.]|nr:TM0106 family RecB-like putative nuclease [Ilumatobacter sp.]MDG2039282.1 TM0106 family RecB-like putative nuclease [Ilumatobacter sp.]
MSGQNGVVADLLLTPSKIAAWLDCAHYLTLKHEVEAGNREASSSPFGEMAQMLLDKGLEHERTVLDRCRAEGLSVCEVPNQDRNESFQHWVDRVRDVLVDGYDIVFQMPFIHDGIRGIADFLRRVDDPETDTFTYEAIDAKLARKEAKPGHVLQLCFYAEAIEAATGLLPEFVHIELGSGRRETIRVSDVLPYWRRLRRQLVQLLDGNPTDIDTLPEPCDHCRFCEFELVCDADWRAADSLVHVAGVRRTDRIVLQNDGVSTISSLAALDREVAELDTTRLETFVRQARLQVEARDAPDDKPPFELLDSPVADDVPLNDDFDAPEPTGFAALPAPDDGDVFLDFEGHPFWRADTELFFLFGLIQRSLAGEWEFVQFWAHNKAEESTATEALINHLAARRMQFPDMHTYHYNHTERSSLERLTVEHGVAELQLDQLISTGQFVDLLPIVRGAMQVGVEGYSLKHLETLTDYERGHEIDQGAGAVVEYEKWMASHDQAGLNRISDYNEDDVRATRALRDWLVTQRPDDVLWREAVLGREEDNADPGERIGSLLAFEPGTVEHLMGDLLGYWRRERHVVNNDAYRLSIADEADQFDSLSAITGLRFEGLEPQYGLKGQELKWPWAWFSFPPQPIDTDISDQSKLIVALNEQEWLFFQVMSIDTEAGEIAVKWKDEADIKGVIPTSFVQYSWFPETAKLAALEDLADERLAGHDNRVGHAILRRDLPAFKPGRGPDGDIFVGEVDAVCTWATGLDRSYVPIQGPPGTGKTFTGAHMIRSMVNAGLRVGVTAMSHAAIGNLMAAVVSRFGAEGDSAKLKAVQKSKPGSLCGVEYAASNARAAEGDFNVIAGTAWLFASPAMRDNPVDVLVVDEAGQLGLADTLAATMAATNVILLGDPQQLPQVAQASHPGGSGASSLEHLLRGELTVPPKRGVLLEMTWRMHPDVCKFISEVMYGGKLRSHPSCTGQSVNGETGLRWLRAEHDGCSTESPEEAALVVAKVEELLGQPWTNQYGVTRPLTVDDFIVVAPYNDQRRCIRDALQASQVARGVEVGTVDKFQGQEAAVVLFSMTTSSSKFMPRHANFLFSKNRLNVAISRARCLAYLVCTDELLDTRARTVEEIELISALCAFVERQQGIS